MWTWQSTRHTRCCYYIREFNKNPAKRTWSFNRRKKPRPSGSLTPLEIHKQNGSRLNYIFRYAKCIRETSRHDLRAAYVCTLKYWGEIVCRKKFDHEFFNSNTMHTNLHYYYKEQGGEVYVWMFNELNTTVPISKIGISPLECYIHSE